MRQKSSKRSKSTSKNILAPQPYQPTPLENSIFQHHLKRQAEKPLAILGLANRSSSDGIYIDHPDETIGHAVMLTALGTSNPEFATGIIDQIVKHTKAASDGGIIKANFMLSIIQGIEPRDEIEAMLALQMASVHMATMTVAGRLASCNNILEQDSTERAFNKLTRTFASQIEALKRYRSDGRQTVRVERVTVEAGGQAVVGTVSLPARGGEDRS